MDIHKNEITALIGPSGCGKSTLIRCLNRMNDLIPDARPSRASCSTTTRTSTRPRSIRSQVRKLIGMVFQKPNPFPKSIFDNVAFGPRVLGLARRQGRGVEQALRAAALWDEVKDRLDENAFGMSGGQQQRLCIARCIAVDPDVILMDEPCSALDPISTGKIEDLMLELKEEFSIVIVTHNMQQAARVSDRTAFLIVELDADEDNRWGQLVEYDRDRQDLHQPLRPADRGLRHREGRLMPESTRLHYQEELEQPRGAGARRARPGHRRALDRTLEAVEHQDIELAQLVIADDDRIDGRYLEVHQEILTLLATQAPVATDLRLISALLHVMQEHRADGRSVREHLQGDPARPATSRRGTSEMVERILRDGQAGAAR